ncbi:hypothetical protein YZ82_01495 [Campylobacter hyointestinalis]|uniref:Uncharacterized protein n=1 Tax=Campylobacter hyointestinalis TaxID=198 RepID=A0A562XKI7_CAMHY|nr:hypothetical protein [Campylobacter hyointestinalis]TWO22617.1 hypothetical protein YZ82_01495 [Campylobacter hyointestinalis]
MDIAYALKEWRETRGLTCQMQQAGYRNNTKEELLEAYDSTTDIEVIDAICDIAILTLNCIEDYKIEDLIHPVRFSDILIISGDIDSVLEANFGIRWISILLSTLNHYINEMGYDFIKCLEETIKEISSRKGEYDPNTKKWVKKITGNEYKADYTKCKKEE